ncbi:MAG: hypothetical protein IPG94_26805 [Kineosporiaceae bacterium]|nr:hypothetical protein [Kineosporiaceae bacterium]
MAMYGTAAAERRKAREARLVEIRKRQAIADELMADEAKHRASALGAWSRLEERAAKMMGYDEPEQVEQTVTTVPADLMALVQQARAEGPFAQMAVDQRIADNLPCPACGGDRLPDPPPQEPGHWRADHAVPGAPRLVPPGAALDDPAQRAGRTA